MKPASMKKFDWLYLGSLAVGMAGIGLNFGTLSSQAEAQMTAQGLPDMASDMLVGGLLFGTAISLGLWVLISILRLELAKWILILLTGWSLLTTARSLDAGIDGTMAWGLVSTVMTLLSIWFLFQPDSKVWFAEKHGDTGTE